MHGNAPELGRTPAAIAWAIEHGALQDGWPSNSLIGSEPELMQRFSVNRLTIRQAIRIVESHGSMVMRRGRNGGLRLTRASVESVAASLATYLCACGCSAAELSELAEVADPLFAARGEPDLIERLYRHTLRLFFTGEQEAPVSEARATVIAMRLLAESTPIPEQGKRIGSEAVLCERFNTCRSTLRQALRVLDDLGMLQVKRGRGGGYLLKRPSAIGMIRQAFTLFASWQLPLEERVRMSWVLNLINLRICARRLQRLDAQTRSHLRDELTALLQGLPEPQRWVTLQQALERAAGATLVGTLQRCIIAHQARLGSPVVAYAMIAEQLGALEDSTVEALYAGKLRAAERYQRRAQELLAQLLLRDAR